MSNKNEEPIEDQTISISSSTVDQTLGIDAAAKKLQLTKKMVHRKLCSFHLLDIAISLKLAKVVWGESIVQNKTH